MSRIVEILRDKVRLLTFLTLLITVAAFLGDKHWVLELTTHFRVQYLALSIFCWLGLLAFREWRWSIAGSLCVVLNALPVVPWYFGRPHQVAGVGATHLRAMLSNVLTSNGNSTGLLDLVQSEAPDILALQEIDDEWLKKVQSLSALFPHSKVIPRSDNFGIGLWSRFPLSPVQEVILTSAEVPSIHAEIEVAG